MSKIIKCAGVPEHFNLPWTIAHKQNQYSNLNIDFRWSDVSQGTGYMCQLLKEKQTDLAIMLTEGSVLNILKGEPFRIVDTYVKTPLYWGVHALKNRAIDPNRFLISRYHSGSHLMTYLQNSHPEELSETSFIVVDHLKGALDYYDNLPKRALSPLFLWEKYTTQPYLEKHQLERIGELPTPWPAFLVVAHEAFLVEHTKLVKSLIKQVHEYIENIRDTPAFFQSVKTYSRLTDKEVKEWMKQTQWAMSTQASLKDDLNKVVKQLHSWKMINSEEVDANHLNLYIGND